MTHHFLNYSSAVLHSSPEDKRNLFQRAKAAVIAETTFVAANLKAFLGCVVIVGAVATDLTTNPSPAEHYSLVGILAAAVIFLVRHVLKQQDKIEKLYDRISRKEKDEEDDEDKKGGHSARRGSR